LKKKQFAYIENARPFIFRIFRLFSFVGNRLWKRTHTSFAFRSKCNTWTNSKDSTGKCRKISCLSI